MLPSPAGCSIQSSKAEIRAENSDRLFAVGRVAIVLVHG
jgi:hypothetical protein